MRTKILFLVLVSITSIAAAAEIRGTWTALVSGDRVQLGVMREHSNWSHTMPRSDFAITDAQIIATSETAVHFVLARDAGSIDFNGTFEAGEGVGRFVFTPSSSYASTLRSLGVASDEALDDEKLFSLAMHDVSLAFIREMQSLGYRENLDSYIRFRIHGVTPDFVRELRSLGYDKLTAQDLVRFRIHGVSPQFIRELKDLGYSAVLSEDLVRMRIHGVTPEFIRELAGAGYHAIPVDKLVRMRIHGISAAMLRKP